MPHTASKSEIQLQKAINAYRRDENQKIAQVAREHGVSYHTLRRRLKGAEPRENRQPLNKALDKPQEDAVRH